MSFASPPPTKAPKKLYFFKVNLGVNISEKQWVKSVEFSVLGVGTLGRDPTPSLPTPKKETAAGSASAQN